jgi:TonB family protein
MTGAGAGMGFGDKGKVQIEAGGNEENFTGTIDKEAVRRVVKSALAQFKACYEKEYRMNSKLEGKVVVQWEIHEQGIAKNAQIVKVKSTINNSAVEECVKNRMMALKFPEPPPGTAAEVTYPFIFQGQKL